MFVNSDIYKVETIDEKSIFIENMPDYDLVMILKYFNANESFMKIISDFIQTQKFKSKMD